MDKFSDNGLDGAEFEVAAQIKSYCAELDFYISRNVTDCRERGIALERLEECAMWATKATAFHGVIGSKTNTVD